VARFLSDAWIADLDEAGRQCTLSPDLRLTLQQVVVEERGAGVAYVIRIADGRISVEPGVDPAPDVTLTQDRTTAMAVARAELSAQSAFMSGRLRVGGDLRGVLDRAQELAVVADVFAAVRSSTTW